MIQTENVIQSAILVSNGTEQEYQITAQVTKASAQTDMLGGVTQHGQVTNGKVRKDEATLATFTCYKSIGISYNIDEDAEQQSVLAAVQNFVAEAKNYADNSVINVTL